MDDDNEPYAFGEGRTRFIVVSRGVHNVLRAMRGDRAMGIVEEYGKLAQSGESDAMYSYANVLRDEDRGPEAELWYHKAAEAGHRDAMIALGDLMEEAATPGKPRSGTAGPPTLAITMACTAWPTC